ncbi:MAG: hypothetical protein JXA24_07850 [Proteobacteria bacterium]|nr:hypothetical protein [Pseudomonadota bacterium]
MSAFDHISVGSIPNCLADLKDFVRGLDREADKARGNAPDGKFTRANYDDALRLRLVGWRDLSAFEGFFRFRDYVESYIENNRFNPICQEESGIAVNESPLDIRSVPRCVMLGGISLYSILTKIDAVANEGKTDGQLSEKEFNDVKRVEADLMRFKDFKQFKSYIRQYIDSQRCTELCLDARNLKSDPEAGGVCVAPDEPSLPDIPAPKKTRPGRTAKAPKKAPDLSAFSPDYPKWLDDPVPYEEDPRFKNDGSSRYASIPSFDDLLEKYVGNAGASPQIDLPGPLRKDRVNYRASFDGKHFIFDLYGCYVRSRADLRCVADWPYFIASLENLRSRAGSSNAAGPDGTVRVRIPAAIGDTVSAFGIDSVTHEFSITKLFFRIMEDKSVVLIRSAMLDDSGEETHSRSSQPDSTSYRNDSRGAGGNDVTKQDVAGFMRHFPGVGTLISMILDPKGHFRNWRQELDQLNCDGYDGTVDDRCNRLKNGVAGSNLER